MSVRPEFVDTNVLLYAYDNTNPAKQAKAADLIERLWLERTGAISIQVTQEFLNNIRRKVASALTLEQALGVVERFSDWHVHSPNLENVIAAARSVERLKVSFWDALILESATALGCDVVWSEDLNHGQVYGGVTVKNPFLEP
jgi:predicted nucleic acid-binding protein